MPAFNREAREQFRRAPASIRVGSYRRASVDSSQLNHKAVAKNTSAFQRRSSQPHESWRCTSLSSQAWLITGLHSDMYEKLQEPKGHNPSVRQEAVYQNQDANHKDVSVYSRSASMPDMGTQESNSNSTKRLGSWTNPGIPPVPEMEELVHNIPPEIFLDDQLGENPNLER